MSKVAKTIAVVAGVIALAASVAVSFGATAPILGVALGTIASVAGAVSAVASVAAGYLAKPPKAQGSVSQVLIGNNLPVAYCMGRTYSGGALVYDVGYGGDKNSDRSMVMIHSVGGPVEGLINLQTDYSVAATHAGAATGYYNDFMWLDWRNGSKPETALASPSGRPTIPDWGSAAKLSGMAAAMVTMKFDTDGKRYASGVPQLGILAKWVKVYDPRLDSTYPGGSGSHRWDDETTWAWSENPSLHALTYCRGRFDNGKRVVGVGLPKDSIDIAAFAELANICTPNGWTVGGIIYEGPGLSKWDNLKRILAAAAAEPAWVAGQLTLKISAPRVSLDTLSTDDLVGAIEVVAMKPRRDRLNTMVPRFRSEVHKWEYVQAAAVVEATYLAEDGESRTEERQFDLVQDVNQVAELAAYALTNGREFTISLTASPRMMEYRPGEALVVDVPEAGLFTQLAVITSRKVDPTNGTVELVLESETSAKHAYALGQLGVAPPTPTITSSEEIDNAVSGGSTTTANISQLILNSYAVGASITASASGNITIANHERIYADQYVLVSGGTIATGAAPGALIAVYYDDPARAGGAVTYQWFAVTSSNPMSNALNSPTHPYRHLMTQIVIPSTSSGGGTGTTSDPDTYYGGRILVETP